MSWTDFLIVFAFCAASILACRVLPLFLLNGRSLPDGVTRALGYIPAVAFAALVANDLLTPGMFDAGIWPAIVPLLAALVVVVVAIKSKSLLLCAIVGVATYAIIMALGG